MKKFFALTRSVIEEIRLLWKTMFNGYHPERHYMRGSGEE
jgi:hypothetical protein